LTVTFALVRTAPVESVTVPCRVKLVPVWATIAEVKQTTTSESNRWRKLARMGSDSWPGMLGCKQVSTRRRARYSHGMQLSTTVGQLLVFSRYTVLAPSLCSQPAHEPRAGEAGKGRHGGVSDSIPPSRFSRWRCLASFN